MTHKKLAPQTAAILAHLQTKGSISNVEAQAVYRCRALPRRIADLKESGYVIHSTMHTDATGQRYARYELAAYPRRLHWTASTRSSPRSSHASSRRPSPT